MPAKKTDWKKERAAMQDDDYPDTGKVLLEKGTRESQGNDGTFNKNLSRGQLLAVLEANRKMYQDLRKMKKKPMGSHHDMMKGLFGGGG